MGEVYREEPRQEAEVTEELIGEVGDELRMLRKPGPDYGWMHPLHVFDLVRDLRDTILHEPWAGRLLETHGIVPWHHKNRRGYPYPDSGLVRLVRI